MTWVATFQEGIVKRIAPPSSQQHLWSDLTARGDWQICRTVTISGSWSRFDLN